MMWWLRIAERRTSDLTYISKVVQHYVFTFKNTLHNNSVVWFWLSFGREGIEKQLRLNLWRS